MFTQKRPCSSVENCSVSAFSFYVQSNSNQLFWGDDVDILDINEFGVPRQLYIRSNFFND